MHEARATYSRHGWLVLGGILLLVAAFWILLREGHRTTGGVNAAGQDLATLSSPRAESAAEKARRAAIGALGPIKRREGINAADLYKEAIGLYAELTEEEKNMLKHPHDKLDPKVAAALYAKIQPIMDLLRSARKAEYVDWGLEPIISKTNLSGKIGREQELTALALWDSTYRFQSDPDGAVGDLAAMDAFGRSEADSAIGLLVDDGIHAGAIDLIAQNAAGITGAAGSDLGDILRPATVEQSFQNGMNAEASMMQRLIDDYANPSTRNESMIEESIIAGNGPAGLPEEMVSEMQWMIQTEATMGTTLMEPDAQFQQWWAQKLSEVSSTPLATDGALPAFVAARTQSQMALVENAMVQAGMALEQNDQAQFQSITDPVTGQPFTYTQTATGFQLGSALQNHGKPVSLNFSTPAAK